MWSPIRGRIGISGGFPCFSGRFPFLSADAADAAVAALCCAVLRCWCQGKRVLIGICICFGSLATFSFVSVSAARGRRPPRERPRRGPR